MAIHVYPENDWIEHRIDQGVANCDCPCDPDIQFIDPDTGEDYDEPMIIHNALDGRE